LNDIPANIDINIEKPIVEKANEYKMSVIRFTCPLYNVPRYYLSNNQFRVIITFFNGATGQTELYTGFFVPPLEPIDSILSFVLAVNSALFQAWNSLITAHPTIPTYYPYIMYDPTTRLMSLIVSKPIFDSEIIGIYFSNDIYRFVYSFPLNTTGSFIAGYKRIYIQNLDMNLYNSPKYPAAPGGYNAYRSFQEFPTDYEFNTLQSIIITTTLPVRNEFVPLSSNQPNKVINTQGNTSGLSYISSIPVLTDFLVPIDRFGQQNQRVFYLPTAEFRWTDFIYSLPLDRLSFNFYYQIADQSISQLTLPPGSYCSMKILLRRK
jgi:hypothetical protein